MSEYDSTDAKSTKAVQVPVFNGKKSQFGIWWPRFKAYCVMKGIQTALKDDFVLPADPTALPTGDEAIKKHKFQVGANASCSAALTLAFTTSTLMDMITSTETTEYAGGIAKDAVKKLFRKYRPDDTISNVEAEAELSGLKFKAGENPERFFERLAIMKTKYLGCKRFEEKELIPISLARAPTEYKSVLTSESRNKGEHLTLDDIQETMVEQYRMGSPDAKASSNEDNEGEVLLYGAEERKCHIYGKQDIWQETAD